MLNFEQPFPLDYHQTLLSLLDVLSEVYNKISKLLGPSPFSHSSQHMMGPLGLLAPHPGVSYLFPADGSSNPYSGSATPNQYNSNPSLSETELGNSLWGIANASIGSSGAMYGGGLASPPPSWTAGYGDMVLKIDGKFKVGSCLPLFLGTGLTRPAENYIDTSEGTRPVRAEWDQRRAGVAGSAPTKHQGPRRQLRRKVYI